MIEIALALSMASSAIANVKKGIEVGREFREVIGDFGKLLDCRDSIIEAQTKGGEQTIVDDATGQALNTAMMIRDINHFENWLKDQLIYSGQGDVYQNFIEERTRIRKAQAAAKKKAAAARAKRRQEIAATTELVLALVIGGVVVGVMVWFGIELILYCKAGRCGH